MMDQILEQILPQVTKPARYTGGEWNSIAKDWQVCDVRWALAFPDIYDLGMSNHGLAILYDRLNGAEGVLAERAFAPWVDMEAAMRGAGLPLFSLESRRPLADFDVIGFSLAYEQVYTNVLNMLDLAGLPVLAAERDERHPLIVAGGGATYNPEPMADFVDAFAIGEGEEVIFDISESIRWAKANGVAREALLRRLAAIPGVYVPRFYDARYHEDGTLAEVTPTLPEAAMPVRKRIVATLPPPVTRPIVPFLDTVHNRGA
ncbi:MAG: B12-binding domain-containing radical SAM protein, partial [Anaerolineae bacterium]